MSSVKGTQSIERTFSIIDLLSKHPEGLRLFEISQKSDIPISTVHRILNFLVQNEYVHTEETNGSYHIGSKFAFLSSIYMQGFNFIKDIHPGLEKINQKFDEAVHLGVLNNHRNMVIYIDKLESSRTVRMFSMVGQSVPVHCTALGKSMFACLSTQDIENSLNEYVFKQFTPNTITSKEMFLAELDKVRKNGYAIDNREHEETIICYGKTFCNNQGFPMAAISISIPAHRIEDHNVNSLVDSLKTTITWIESKFS